MKQFSLLISLLAVALFACDNRKEAMKEEVPAKTISAEVAKSNKPETPAASAKETSGKLAKFEFEETSYDFGDINQGDVVDHTFKFTNVGEAPLVISNIRTTCGCTTPEYTKDPIAPGETGEILVQFNSRGKSGTQRKAITINANVEGGKEVITITSQVKVEEQVPGPYKNQAQ